jgi:membrane associated rhomboid family serine protease
MLIPLRDNLNFKGTPVLVFILIAINTLVFAAWQGGSQVSERKIVEYSVIPYEVTHPGTQCVPKGLTQFRCGDEEEIERETGQKLAHTGVTVITSMFMHGSWMHLIGNMIFLFAFGAALELALGRFAFALFYLTGGLAAEAGHTLFDPSSPIPSLGASGAISAVMAGFLMLFPAAKLRTLLWPLPPILVWLRANILIFVLLMFQVLEAYFVLSAYGKEGGGVAYFAHFGGFLFGLLLLKLVTDKPFLDQQRLHAQIASGDVRLVRQEHLVEPANPGVPEYAGAHANPAVAGAAYADPFAAPQAAGFAPQPQFAQQQAQAQFAPGQPQFAPPPPQFAASPQPNYATDPFAPPQAPHPNVAPDPFAPPPSPQSNVAPDPFAPPHQPGYPIAQNPPQAPPRPPQPQAPQAPQAPDLSQAPPPPPPAAAA